VKGICSRRPTPGSARKVRYRTVNKPRVIRFKAVPWDQLTRDEDGRPVIDEKLTS
jgi:hypothetical protein